MNEEIKKELDRQIEMIDLSTTNVDGVNEIIKKLGGDKKATTGDFVCSTCYYITLLAVKNLYESHQPIGNKE